MQVFYRKYRGFIVFFIVISAMLAAMDVVNRLKELKINALHIKLRARGGIYSPFTVI